MKFCEKYSELCPFSDLDIQQIKDRVNKIAWETLS